jgi:hypothetical protein
MAKVELLEIADLFGMIVVQPSGVLWVGNAGGASCYHPEVEGIFVPLDHTMLPAQDILVYDFWFSKDLMIDQKDFIAEYLHQNCYLDTFFEPDPDMAPETEFGEAWIPVKVRDSVDEGFTFATVMRPFVGRRAVIVYTNSA